MSTTTAPDNEADFQWSSTSPAEANHTFEQAGIDGFHEVKPVPRQGVVLDHSPGSSDKNTQQDGPGDVASYHSSVGSDRSTIEYEDVVEASMNSEQGCTLEEYTRGNHRFLTTTAYVSSSKRAQLFAQFTLGGNKAQLDPQAPHFLPFSMGDVADSTREMGLLQWQQQQLHGVAPNRLSNAQPMEAPSSSGTTFQVPPQTTQQSDPFGPAQTQQDSPPHASCTHSPQSPRHPSIQQLSPFSSRPPTPPPFATSRESTIQRHSPRLPADMHLRISRLEILFTTLRQRAMQYARQSDARAVDNIVEDVEDLALGRTGDDSDADDAEWETR
ncbi:hypothetical protein MBLNU230_g3164t1 [Neophaeotheca triangularis]